MSKMFGLNLSLFRVRYFQGHLESSPLAAKGNSHSKVLCLCLVSLHGCRVVMEGFPLSGVSVPGRRVATGIAPVLAYQLSLVALMSISK